LKKIIAITLIIFSLGIFQGFSNNNFEITVLTCSPGKETYSAWGHTAIRVVDRKANIDVVYNFGLFDFNTPNFYPKFIKGRLLYKLGAEYPRNFYRAYYRENRQIIEQKLNLTEDEAIKIIQELQFLYLPENRYYLYRFAGKNCTSEVRDLILENIQTDFENTPTEKTIRDQLNEYLKDRLWLRFSMSLIMGYKVDRKINSFDSMFLPDYLCFGLRELTTPNGKLVKEEHIFNELYEVQNPYPFLFNPFLILLLIAIVVLAFHKRYIQSPLLFIIGFTGLVIFTLSMVTEHPELRYNLNALWINPLYLVLLFLKKGTKLKRNCAIILIAMLLSMIPIWLFKVQYFEWSYFPIFILLTCINLRYIYPNKRLQLI